VADLDGDGEPERALLVDIVVLDVDLGSEIGARSFSLKARR